MVLGLSYGPIAAFFPELFETRFRYTGSGLAYNLGGIVGGAFPTLIAGTLMDTYGETAIGVMLAIFAVISLVCTCSLRETRGFTL